MEIEERILQQYYEQAAVDQLTSEYEKKGFEVTKDYRVKNYRFDLLAKKENESIIFEIKVGSWKKDQRNQIKQLRNIAVHELGAKFKLVLVSLPKESEIIIEDLEPIFPELLSERFINEFSEMATHFWVDGVSNFEFDKLVIRKSDLEIKGSGVISVGFQFGSDSDYKQGNGLCWYDSFEFSFHLLLDREIEIKEIYELEIDL